LYSSPNCKTSATVNHHAGFDWEETLKQASNTAAESAEVIKNALILGFGWLKLKSQSLNLDVQ
jgi:hypothetical protein